MGFRGRRSIPAPVERPAPGGPSRGGGTMALYTLLVKVEEDEPPCVIASVQMTIVWGWSNSTRSELSYGSSSRYQASTPGPNLSRPWSVHHRRERLAPRSKGRGAGQGRSGDRHRRRRQPSGPAVRGQRRSQGEQRIDLRAARRAGTGLRDPTGTSHDLQFRAPNTWRLQLRGDVKFTTARRSTPAPSRIRSRRSGAKIRERRPSLGPDLARVIDSITVE